MLAVETENSVAEEADSGARSEKCEKPVIAATHAIAIGGAIDLISACDIRYAASDSIFSIKEVDVGLAADIGTLQRWPKIIGNDSMARELALTARNFDAKEAKEIGFLSKVVQGSHKEVVGELLLFRFICGSDPLVFPDSTAEAIKTAAEIATKSPVATRGTKALMVYSRDHS